LLRQQATIDVSLRVVDVKSEAVIWKKDKLKGFLKYVRSFQAETPRPLKKPIDEKIVRANMRQHLAMRLVHALYPDEFADKDVPEILEKPKQKLKYAGGDLIIF